MLRAPVVNPTHHRFLFYYYLEVCIKTYHIGSQLKNLEYVILSTDPISLSKLFQDLSKLHQ